MSTTTTTTTTHTTEPTGPSDGNIPDIASLQIDQKGKGKANQPKKLNNSKPFPSKEYKYIPKTAEQRKAEKEERKEKAKIRQEQNALKANKNGKGKSINQQIEESEKGVSKKVKRGGGIPPIPAEILPFLFLGSAHDAKNPELVKKHNFTHILNVAEEFSMHDTLEGVDHVRMIVADHMEVGQHQHNVFEDAFKLIGKFVGNDYFSKADFLADEVKEKQSAILVHCMRGRSRSATIVIGMSDYLYFP